jgi:hypothetical protein
MVERLEAEQVALAAARGVAIALAAGKPPAPRAEWRIICGIPPVIYEAFLQADAEGNIAIKSVQETKTL